MHSSLQTRLLAMLQAYQAHDAQEAAHHRAMLEFVRQTPACTSREHAVGHVTASAWILSPDQQAVLLTHHGKLNRWLQLGGHVEQDDSIAAAAMREAVEESGMQDLVLISPQVFDLDVHWIPARKTDPAHYHYDVRFAFQAVSERFVINEESNHLQWVPLAGIFDLVQDESIARMVRKTAPLLREQLT